MLAEGLVLLAVLIVKYRCTGTATLPLPPISAEVSINVTLLFLHFTLGIATVPRSLSVLMRIHEDTQEQMQHHHEITENTETVRTTLTPPSK